MRFDLLESIAAMRDGRKTQTRRRSPYWLRKKPGSRITIVHQGEYLGHATIVRTWAQEIGQLSDDEGRAEGYEGAAGFYDAWEKLYGNRYWSGEERIYVVEFKDVTWAVAQQSGSEGGR